MLTQWWAVLKYTPRNRHETGRKVTRLSGDNSCGKEVLPHPRNDKKLQGSDLKARLISVGTDSNLEKELL